MKNQEKEISDLVVENANIVVIRIKQGIEVSAKVFYLYKFSFQK